MEPSRQLSSETKSGIVQLPGMESSQKGVFQGGFASAQEGAKGNSCQLQLWNEQTTPRRLRGAVR